MLRAAGGGAGQLKGRSEPGCRIGDTGQQFVLRSQRRLTAMSLSWHFEQFHWLMSEGGCLSVAIHGTIAAGG